VAIKVLHPELSGSMARDRFAREIRLAAGLSHPHILPVYDSGEAGDALYFVMPVMRGDTLRDRMRAEPRLPVATVTRIGAEVADALDYAHRQGFVHRDIKPENILLHEGHALVADFGIGKAVAAAVADTAQLTQVGSTLGTPAYMSPEQAAGEECDGRSDLYALGCVLYEMLTGEAAFSGPTAAAVIARRFMHTPPSVTVARPDVPSSVATLVSRLLARDAVDRPASGAAVSAELLLPSAPVNAQPRPEAMADEHTIAVLPFVNMSTDADDAFFSDGLLEEITTDLSRVRTLRVTARASSSLYRASTQPPRDIGRALGVRYLLTGSVRRSPTALRISAQLVDAESERQLWAERFDGTMHDVFDVQERVSREIVSALGVTLSTEEDRRLASRGFVIAEAYELYLLARAEMRNLRHSADRWTALLDRAVALEGDTPVLRALRLWGQVALIKLGLGDGTSLDAIAREAEALAQEAPDRAWGYAIGGYVAIERGNMVEAIRAFRLALARDPMDSDARYWLVTACGYAGLLAEAAQEATALRERDPLSSMSWIADQMAPFFDGRFAETQVGFERTVAAEPSNFAARWTLSYVQMMQGQLDSAEEQLAGLRAVAPDTPYVLQLDGLLRALHGDAAGALDRVQPLDLGPFDGHLVFHIAEVFAQSGEVERGLDVLALAVAKGFTATAFIATHCPALEPLRSSPRFAGIVAASAERSAEVRARTA